MPSTEAPALAAAAAELYRVVAGVQLEQTERPALDVMLATDTDGKWQEPTCKGWFGGAVLEARALAGLFLLDERSIVWSTHLYATARAASTRMREIVDGSEALRLQVKRAYLTRGEERIELRGDRVIRFFARTRYSGRGMSADCLFMDEAQAERGRFDDVLRAHRPMVLSRPNAQLVISHGGSAGVLAKV